MQRPGAQSGMEPTAMNKKRALKAMLTSEISTYTTEFPQSLATQEKWCIYFTFLRCTSGHTASDLKVLHLKGHLEDEEKYSEHVM